MTDQSSPASSNGSGGGSRSPALWDEAAEALPGMARIAATAWMRSAAWAVGSGVRSGRLLARALTHPEAAGELVPDLKLDVGIAHLERLRVRVDSDELDALEALVDHAVDGVRPAAADADDLDDRQVATCVHVSGCLSTVRSSSKSGGFPAPAKPRL